MSERFAVLDHDWPFPHRDLLLERGGVLRAWRLPAEFTFDQPVPAEAIADHRLLYLDYEGPLSGDRGTVRRWDGGAVVWVKVVKGCLRFELQGVRLNGTFELKSIEGAVWEATLSRGSAGSLRSPGSTPG